MTDFWSCGSGRVSAVDLFTSCGLIPAGVGPDQLTRTVPISGGEQQHIDAAYGHLHALLGPWAESVWLFLRVRAFAQVNATIAAESADEGGVQVEQN
jgi:hypothetical protein